MRRFFSLKILVIFIGYSTSAGGSFCPPGSSSLPAPTSPGQYTVCDKNSVGVNLCLEIPTGACKDNNTVTVKVDGITISQETYQGTGSSDICTKTTGGLISHFFPIGTHSVTTTASSGFSSTFTVSVTPCMIIDQGGKSSSFWKKVPGNGTTDKAIAATAATDLEGDYYIFAKGIDDKHIYMNSVDAYFEKWSGWTEVPGGGTTDQALAATTHKSILYLFGKGIDDKRIYVNSTRDGKTWSGWTEVPGGGTTDQALAATTHESILYLFRKGIDDKRIYVNSTRDGKTWSGWTKVPGGGTTDQALAATTHKSILYLFGKGIDDKRIYVNSTRDGKTWSDWTGVPGGDTTDVAVAATECVSEDRKLSLCLFWKGASKQTIYVKQAFYEDRLIWYETKPLPGQTDVSIAAVKPFFFYSYHLFSKGIKDRQIYFSQGVPIIR